MKMQVRLGVTLALSFALQNPRRLLSDLLASMWLGLPAARGVRAYRLCGLILTFTLASTLTLTFILTSTLTVITISPSRY